MTVGRYSFPWLYDKPAGDLNLNLRNEMEKVGVDKWVKHAKIDPMLSKAIPALINLGLVPIWSCQGHGRKDQDNSYVMFIETGHPAERLLIELWRKCMWKYLVNTSAPVSFTTNPCGRYAGLGRPDADEVFVDCFSLEFLSRSDSERKEVWEAFDAMISKVDKATSIVRMAHLADIVTWPTLTRDIGYKLEVHGTEVHLVINGKTISVNTSDDYGFNELHRHLVLAEVDYFYTDDVKLEDKIIATGLFK